MTPPLTSSQPSRPRRRDAAENRAAILVAATACLRVQADATLQTIADRAGLTRRALYGHFATREDLIAELVLNGASRVTASLAGLDGLDTGDSRVAIARMGSVVWREVSDVRVMARLAVRGEFAHTVAEALAPVRQQLVAVVTRGVAAGELRQDIEPALLARLIEGAALAVLDETTRSPLTGPEGSRLVMQASLAMAGLSWTETNTTIASLGDTATGAPGTTSASPPPAAPAAPAAPTSTPAPAPAPNTPTTATPAAEDL